MQRTKVFIMRVGISICVGIIAAPVSAQTVLSPAPIMPLQSPVSAIPHMTSAAEGQDESATYKTFQIPFILNESVESQIEYFTTGGRAVFQNWLRRSARYLPLMKRIFREYNLPEDLVYVSMIESGFNPHAVSPKNAVGPWQFMRATAKEYGLNADYWVDERRDPVKSTRAAAAHLKDLYNTFGSWLMALASYNAGTGRMRGAALKAKSDDFWEICDSRFIKSETQEYVPRYLAAMIIAKDPVSYGFDDPESEPFEYDEIVIHGSTDLRQIAGCAGSSYQELRDLNPELLQHWTPRTSYVLRIPPGAKDICEQKLASMQARKRKVTTPREKTQKNEEIFSGKNADKNTTATRKNTPIVSPFAAELNFERIGAGRKSEALLSSGNTPFRVLR